MGHSNSKQVKDNECSETNDKKTRRADFPKEKHNSADSQAPLAKHAANFACPRIASLERHRSIASEIGLSHLRTRSTEKETVLNPYTPAGAPSPTLPASSSKAGVQTQISGLGGHSNVTRPPPPPRLHHLSELIDPAELPMDCHIRSPSGSLLALEQFLVHPNRPRSIRERQEEIKEKVRATSRLGIESGKGENEIIAKDSEVEESKNGQRKRKESKSRGCLCFASL